MSKFVLDTDALSVIISDINSLSAQLEEIASSISETMAGDGDEFNFAGAIACIQDNIRMASQKMKSTASLIQSVIDAHMQVQNSMTFEPTTQPQATAAPVADVQSTAAPVANTSATAAPAYVEHVVTSKDTLHKIATNYNTTVGAIATANNIKNVDLIYKDDVLIIPNDNNASAAASNNYEGASALSSATPSTANSSNSSNSAAVSNAKETVSAQFTAYYPADNALEGGFYDALGNLLDPSSNTCAAPPEIPFGTKIQITDTGTDLDGQIFTVTDRGGAIKINSDGSYHFDILMSSSKECNNWGVKGGKAIILDK